MLVLSRKKDDVIVIDNGKIRIVVVDIQGDKVRLGIDAPREISVDRKEVYDAIEAEKKSE